MTPVRRRGRKELLRKQPSGYKRADMLRPPTYRAFVSYSHRDGSVFDEVSKHLRELGLHPWSDADLAAGKGFTEGIQTDIAHAHLFVPILTAQSHKRGWVHQEIGYAVAMKVPCVPICVGKVPEGMIAMAHAIVLNGQLDGLKEKLGRVHFEQIVREAGQEWVPPVGCAGQPEERARMIERLSEEALVRLGPSCVRINAGLSSFSLPDEAPDHSAWTARYSNHPRTHYAYGWFRRERVALARHAVSGGLKMILNPTLEVDELYGIGAKHARLSVLIRFLESLPPGHGVSIALVAAQQADHIVAVGDWFMAESLGDRVVRGVKQTVFTAHAPTVSRAIADFDRKIASVLASQGSPPGESRRWAVEQLNSLLSTLPPHPTWHG